MAADGAGTRPRRRQRLDRVNVSFAALDMNKDLGFSASVFGLGAGILFFTYMRSPSLSLMLMARLEQAFAAEGVDFAAPIGTPVKVTREGQILRGPGIGDNCRGLAVLVSIARSLNQADVRTEGTITLVANVGEEGLGDRAVA